MQKFNALLFDFDGILFDSEAYHLQACNQITPYMVMVKVDFLLSSQV